MAFRGSVEDVDSADRQMQQCPVWRSWPGGEDAAGRFAQGGDAALQGGALVAQERLGQTRRHGADAVLARPSPYDDGDVRVPYVVLDLPPEHVDGLAVLAEQIEDRNAAHRCGGPQEHLGGAVLA